MLHNEGEIDNLINRMLKRGFVCTSHHWIARAAEQKNPRLTLDLAYSTLLLYDHLDKRLMNLQRLN
jgi:L-arabinose isomerase